MFLSQLLGPCQDENVVGVDNYSRIPICLNWAASGFRISSLCIGTLKYASFGSTFFIQSPAVSRSLKTWMFSILKCSVWTNLFRHFRLITGLWSHLSLVPKRLWTGNHAFWVWSLLWQFLLSCSGSPPARDSSLPWSVLVLLLKRLLGERHLEALYRL